MSDQGHVLHLASVHELRPRPEDVERWPRDCDPLDHAPRPGRVVVTERNHRGLVRRNGWPSEHHQPILERAHGGTARDAGSVPASWLESAVSHDEGVWLRVRLFDGGPTLESAPVAVHAGLQDATRVQWKQPVLSIAELSGHLGDGDEPVGGGRLHVRHGGHVSTAHERR
uniref:(northern house mosquito) hypothetical protein n=1 Tax=Culex pipiens TaxID=7175 RepID=A0A8D8C5N0_CULPI